MCRVNKQAFFLKIPAERSWGGQLAIDSCDNVYPNIVLLHETTCFSQTDPQASLWAGSSVEDYTGAVLWCPIRAHLHVELFN